MSTTITTDFLCELADTFQTILAQLHDGRIDPAAALANETIERLAAFLPERSVEDLGRSWHAKLTGMFCRVEGETHLGIILGVDDARHEVRVLALAECPQEYISDWDLVFPLLDVKEAWPADGLTADVDAAAVIQSAEEAADLDPGAETELQEPESVEPDGWPITREEFGMLPNKSTVAVSCAEGGLLAARRTRKNRWLLDEATGTISDSEAWEELLGASTDEVVYCTHEARR